MKMFKFLLPLSLLALTACVGSPSIKKESLSYKASNVATCTITSSTNYNGPVSGNLSATCTGAGTTPVTPPVVTPPVVNPTPPVSTVCSENQLSSPLGTVQLKRQCQGITQWHSDYIADTNGPQTDLAVITGGSWPTYKSGYTPAYQIQEGYYVSLAFTPTRTGSVQMVPNASYGDGGIISVSTTPGLFLPGPGVICQMAQQGRNNIQIGTNSGNCVVNIGTTYYVNYADYLSNGQQACVASKTKTCPQPYTFIAYTLYTSQ